MATGPECPREETMRERMERRKADAQAQIEKCDAMLKFLDAHPEFEEYEKLKDAVRY